MTTSALAAVSTKSVRPHTYERALVRWPRDFGKESLVDTASVPAPPVRTCSETAPGRDQTRSVCAGLMIATARVRSHPWASLVNALARENSPGREGPYVTAAAVRA